MIACGTALAAVTVVLLFNLWLPYAVNWPRGDDFILLDWYRRIVSEHNFELSKFQEMRVANHPLATFMILGVAILSLFGLNFKVLITFNLLIVLASAMILSSLVLRELGPSLSGLFTSLSILLVLFHPEQVSHLLWAFEGAWFLVNFFLIVNLVLVESTIRFKFGLIVLSCLLGLFCSAHGSVLWLAAAIHLSMRNVKSKWIQVATLLMGFAASVLYVRSLAPSDVKPIHLADAGRFAKYFVTLLGTLFSQRIEHQDFLHGIVVSALAVLSLILGISGFKTSAMRRASIVMLVTSFVFLLEFAVGRSQYGIDWALSAFHMAPLYVLLLVGIVLSFGAVLSSRRLSPDPLSISISAPILYLLASCVYSLPSASHFAETLALKERLARHFVCTPDSTPYLEYGLNFGIGNRELVSRNLPLLQRNCGDEQSPDLQQALRYPQYFYSLAARRPDAKAALTALWEVYLLHFDLSEAFHRDDPKRGEKLLAFAVASARTGSQYDPEKLKPYEDVFLTLGTEEEHATR